ncbi:MAG: helix-turn-helix domain-containing protein [Clostridia bacterium]
MTKPKRHKMAYQTPPLNTILAAMQEDPQAMDELTRFYRPYICTLATRHLYDASGSIHAVVDEQLCRELEIKLIMAVLKFRIR